MIRKFIKPGTRLAVRLSSRERDLVIERAFLNPAIEAALHQAIPAGSKLVIHLNLDDIDELLGYVAAEANHCEDAKVQRTLDNVCARLSNHLDQYTDEHPGERVARMPHKARFTAKQGQYLAYIQCYTKVHRVPPAEADLERYFRVSPPAVHAMILTLERQGLIDRTPGKPRSIRLRVPETEVPALS